MLSLAFLLLASAPQHSDAEIERAWLGLARSEKREVVEWFGLELDGIDTLELRLVRYLARRADVDPGFWPARGPAPFFEPGGKRRRLDTKSVRSGALRHRIAYEEPPVWSYDFASRRLVSNGDPDDPDRAFEEALAGRHPDREYSVALLERMLDDGRYLDSFAALSHAYSEPDGSVHAEITIDDVLASGEALPLNEVDGIEIARWVQGDASPWTAPVPASRRPELDRIVVDLFDEADVWRKTVRTIARSYFVPDATAEFAADPLLLHALWLSVESDPVRMADLLPAPDGLRAFFGDWEEQFRGDALATDATHRRVDLENGADPVRRLLDRILTEFGAFGPRAPIVERESSTAPPSAPGRSGIALEAEAEARLLRQLERMGRSRRKKLAARCLEAARSSGARQVELVEQWLARAPSDRDELPEPTSFPAFDANEYGGGTPRRLRRSGDRRWERVARDISAEPARAWPRRADYELATGEIVATPADERIETSLRDITLLLRGVLPDQDLAEAAILRALDAGAGLRPEAVYFAHLYADREGRAYEGITLFDAWSSDISLEIPDVDALAYAREVWSDTTVDAPLSGAEQKTWYPRIAASLKELRNRINVGRAIAAIWFEARPELPLGYDASIDILHASLARFGEDTAALAERLEADGIGFLQKALREISAMGNDGWDAGNSRREELADGAHRLRQATLSVLSEEGLFGD